MPSNKTRERPAPGDTLRARPCVLLLAFPAPSPEGHVPGVVRFQLAQDPAPRGASW